MSLTFLNENKLSGLESRLDFQQTSLNSANIRRPSANPTRSNIRAWANEPRISCLKNLRSKEIDSVNASTRRSILSARRPPDKGPTTVLSWQLGRFLHKVSASRQLGLKRSSEILSVIPPGRRDRCKGPFSSMVEVDDRAYDAAEDASPDPGSATVPDIGPAATPGRDRAIMDPTTRPAGDEAGRDPYFQASEVGPAKASAATSSSGDARSKSLVPPPHEGARRRAGNRVDRRPDPVRTSGRRCCSSWRRSAS